VQLAVRGGEFLRRLADGIEAGEVEPQRLDRGRRRLALDLGRRRARLVQVATGEHHLRSLARHLARGLEADTTVASGDDDRLAVEVRDVSCGPGHVRSPRPAHCQNRPWPRSALNRTAVRLETKGMPLPPLVEAMLRPEFYPHRPETVELRQTHISFVFVAGDEVYKVKKPVRFTFLDFTTLERRRHYCHEEVRLNRRLAPDVYLGVVGLARHGDEWQLTEESDAAEEYAVRMRRLPDDRTLHRLLQRGAVEG